MHVGRLTQAHASEYRAIMLHAYESEPDAFTSTVSEREPLPIEWWEARVSDRPDAEALVYGAFADDSIVGVAGLRFERRKRTKHKAILYGTYVSPSYRRRGVARKLVEAVLEHARSAPEIRMVLLRVTASNAAAVQLYESCGFASFGTEPYANRVGDRFVPVANMWCAVKPLPEDSKSLVFSRG